MITIKLTQTSISAQNTAEVKNLILQSFKSQDLTIDLSNVSFIDSSGLGMMVSLLKSTDNQIILTKMNDKVKALFSLTKMDKIFRVLTS